MKSRQREMKVTEVFPTYESEEAREEALNRLAYDLAVIAEKHRNKKLCEAKG